MEEDFYINSTVMDTYELLWGVLLIVVVALAYLFSHLHKVEEQVEALKWQLRQMHEQRATTKKETECPPVPDGATAHSSMPSSHAITLPLPTAVPTEAVREAVGERPKASALSGPPPLPPNVSVRPTSHATSDSRNVRETGRLEKWIGENLLAKIGIFVLVLGMAFFVKYAIDQNWIGETIRTIIGFVIGFGLVGLGHYLLQKNPLFSSLLIGGGFAIFFLTTAIAFHYYALFPHTIAFAILCIATFALGVISLRTNRMELALTAIFGGFLAPFLVATEDAHLVALYVYIAILNVGSFALAFRQRWPWLVVVAFLGTVITQGMSVLADDSMANSIFALFAFVFFLLSVRLLLREATLRHIGLVSVIVGNALAVVIFTDGRELCPFLGHYFGLTMMLAVALTYGLLAGSIWRKKGMNSVVGILLSVAFGMGTMAIPLHLSEHLGRVIWGTELIVFTLLALRLQHRLFAGMRWAMFALMLLAWTMGYVIERNQPLTESFFSPFLLGQLTLCLAWVVSAILLHCAKEKGVALWPLGEAKGTTLANVVALLTPYAVLAQRLDKWYSGAESIASVGLLTAGVVALCTFVFSKRYPMLRWPLLYVLAMAVGVGSFVVATTSVEVATHTGTSVCFNGSTCFFALLTMLRVGLLYRHSSVVRPWLRACLSIGMAVLLLFGTLYVLHLCGMYNDSLTISLGLTAIAIGLMGVGLRWNLQEVRQLSLCGLLIVVGKLLLLDVWTFSALWKIVVFIFLGIVLLSLSFLYQHLRTWIFEERKGEGHASVREACEQKDERP